DPGLVDLLQEWQVLGETHPVAQPGGAEVGQDVADVVGSEQLPAVRQARQPGPPGDGEGGGELAGVTAPLVVAQPEADDPVVHVPHRQAGQGAGVERVAGAGGGDDHPDLDADVPARRPGLVQDDLQGRGEPTDVRRVG